MLSQANRRCLAIVAALWAAAIAFMSGAEAAQVLPGPFAIKPPDIAIPAGTKPGTLRRVIQPFGPWTLVCDENLTTRKRICNVSQTIIDPSGATVFSWSLAASQDGAPIFIVRLPAALAGDHFVQVEFGHTKPVDAGVILSVCDAAVCLGYLNVDAKIQRQIAAQAEVAIKVRLGPGVQTFSTSLDGLKQAVASLK